MATTLEIAGDVIDADAVTREEYAWPAEATEHPVERGVNLVDHVRPGALQVELELLITDAPTATPAFGADGARVVPGRPVLAFDRALRRALRVSERLRAAQVGAELATLNSARRGTIENLAVVEVREPYEAARGATITVRLRQVRVAEARTVAIPEALQDRGKPRRDRGKQPSAAVPPVQRASLLSKLSGYGKAVE